MEVMWREATSRKRVKRRIGEQQQGGIPFEGFAVDRWGVFVQMFQDEVLLLLGKPARLLWVRWQGEECENAD